MEIYNTGDDISHVWKVGAIKFGDVNSKIFLPTSKMIDAPTITIKEYELSNERLFNERDKSFKARQPKGIKVTSSKRFNLGIEKEFSWH